MENNNNLKIEVVQEGEGNPIIPRKAVEHSAGYDLYVPKDQRIVHGRNIVKIGIKLGIPAGIDGHIRPRSGFSVNGMEGYTIPLIKWLKPKKKRFDADVIQGTIDCGYKDEIGVIIRNNDKPFILKQGTRIAQIVFNRHEQPELIPVVALSGFDRGGGFGHTGVL